MSNADPDDPCQERSVEAYRSGYEEGFSTGYLEGYRAGKAGHPPAAVVRIDPEDMRP